MKPLRFKAWAAVDERGDVMWALDENGTSMPLCSTSKPTKEAIRAHGCTGVAPILVTITAAKRVAKRRRR